MPLLDNFTKNIKFNTFSTSEGKAKELRGNNIETKLLGVPYNVTNSTIGLIHIVVELNNVSKRQCLSQQAYF